VVEHAELPAASVELAEIVVEELSATLIAIPGEAKCAGVSVAVGDPLHDPFA
jgi:hypothetical protein